MGELLGVAHVRTARHKGRGELRAKQHQGAQGIRLTSMFASIFGIKGSTRRGSLVGPVQWAAVVALLSTIAVRANEIGTTRVSVLFQEGRTYDVTIVTDATALVEKLVASTGRSSPADTRPGRLQSLLTSF